MRWPPPSFSCRKPGRRTHPAPRPPSVTGSGACSVTPISASVWNATSRSPIVPTRDGVCARHEDRPRGGGRDSFADDLDQHPLAPPAVELAVENLFPGTEIELALRDGHHHLAAHDLALQMRVGVVLAGIEIGRAHV